MTAESRRKLDAEVRKEVEAMYVDCVECLKLTRANNRRTFCETHYGIVRQYFLHPEKYVRLKGA
jgi:hypothetical protein